jgi:hypothetical protein
MACHHYLKDERDASARSSPSGSLLALMEMSWKIPTSPPPTTKSCGGTGAATATPAGTPSATTVTFEPGEHHRVVVGTADEVGLLGLAVVEPATLQWPARPSVASGLIVAACRSFTGCAMGSHLASVVPGRWLWSSGEEAGDGSRRSKTLSAGMGHGDLHTVHILALIESLAVGWSGTTMAYQAHGEAGSSASATASGTP